MKKLLANSTSPQRVQLYFDTLMLLHAIPVACLGLFDSGTCANEAFHAELNNWFRNQSELHASTVELQLGFNVIAKMLAHNSAMYYPTLRQLSPALVTARPVENSRQGDAPWHKYSEELVRDGVATLGQGKLPLRDARQKLSVPLKEHSHRTAPTFKRPMVAAFGVKHMILKRPTTCSKRTAFSLKRVRVVGKSAPAK